MFALYAVHELLLRNALPPALVPTLAHLVALACAGDGITTARLVDLWCTRGMVDVATQAGLRAALSAASAPQLPHLPVAQFRLGRFGAEGAPAVAPVSQAGQAAVLGVAPAGAAPTLMGSPPPGSAVPAPPIVSALSEGVDGTATRRRSRRWDTDKDGAASAPRPAVAAPPPPVAEAEDPFISAPLAAAPPPFAHSGVLKLNLPTGPDAGHAAMAAQPSTDPPALRAPHADSSTSAGWTAPGSGSSGLLSAQHHMPHAHVAAAGGHEPSRLSGGEGAMHGGHHGWQPPTSSAGGSAAHPTASAASSVAAAAPHSGAAGWPGPFAGFPGHPGVGGPAWPGPFPGPPMAFGGPAAGPGMGGPPGFMQPPGGASGGPFHPHPHPHMLMAPFGMPMGAFGPPPPGFPHGGLPPGMAMHGLPPGFPMGGPPPPHMMAKGPHDGGAAHAMHMHWAGHPGAPGPFFPMQPGQPPPQPPFAPHTPGGPHASHAPAPTSTREPPVPAGLPSTHNVESMPVGAMVHVIKAAKAAEAALSGAPAQPYLPITATSMVASKAPPSEPGRIAVRLAQFAARLKAINDESPADGREWGGGGGSAPVDEDRARFPTGRGRRSRSPDRSPARGGSPERGGLGAGPRGRGGDRDRAHEARDDGRTFSRGGGGGAYPGSWAERIARLNASASS
jgi:hypothetical protein